MARGILILGLNGCGKTTVGRSLAALLGFAALDAEAFYFPVPGDYSQSRSAAEAHALMKCAIDADGDFVLTCVRCNLPDDILAHVQLCVVLRALLELRAQRILQRETDRFAQSVLPGGDRYEEYMRFAAFAASRSEETVDASLDRLSCPVMEADASLAVEDVAYSIRRRWYSLQ